jgi:hypothetical protein
MAYPVVFKCLRVGID